jgi:hypothetical protein
VLRPTVGELLEGVRAGLAAQVLPALPAGAEARQLKAALQVLGILATTWDRQRAILEADNADIDSTIEVLWSRSGWNRESVDDPGAESEDRFPGVGDEELRRVMARNELLQQELEVLQQRRRRDRATDASADRLLLELHIRTTARAEDRNDGRAPPRRSIPGADQGTDVVC